MCKGVFKRGGTASTSGHVDTNYFMQSFGFKQTCQGLSLLTSCFSKEAYWPDRAKLDLWPFALEHAVYIWNHLPKKDSLIAPVESFTGGTFGDFEHISRARDWGCSAYILDPKLQDGKKIPKWDPRSRRSMFIGMSPSHSELAMSLRIPMWSLMTYSQQFQMGRPEESWRKWLSIHIHG
jgi:hypothetical protein